MSSDSDIDSIKRDLTDLVCRVCDGPGKKMAAVMVAFWLGRAMTHIVEYQIHHDFRRFGFAADVLELSLLDAGRIGIKRRVEAIISRLRSLEGSQP